ncbi:glyoxalase [Vibrio vulnificus]|nr:glyoxalase [Vibrio vulnificus]
MITIDSIVLYVESIQTSQEFYEKILPCKVKALSPTFVSFKLPDGPLLELKQLAHCNPSSSITGGGTEISILIKNRDALHCLFQDWSNKGIQFLLEPIEQIYGITFVAIDPDNHRIRVFAE